MRLSRLAGLLTLGILWTASMPSLATQEGQVWITLEHETVLALQDELARAGRPHDFTLERDGPIAVGRLSEGQIARLSRLVHRRTRRCGGFMAHESREAALRESLREPAAAEVEPQVVYSIDNGAVVSAMIGQLQEPNIRDTITGLAAYHTRYYTTQTSVDAANWLKTRWQGYAQGRSDVTVELFSHAGWIQPSVILTITGATLPSEVVVLGAHLDSIYTSQPSTGRAPGADDDGSGVASLTESVRAAMATGYRPARTVKFMAYAAEEVGLRGSQEIANKFKNDGVNVVGVLQLDMTNYKGSTIDIAIITDNTNAAQNTFLRNLVDTYVGLPRADTQCGYACSDHASWTGAGFVASFPFEALMGQHNQTLHTPNDTLAQSGNNANHALKFAKVSTAYMGELAKGGFPGGNLPPIAGAGPDKSASTGANITLDGSGSDPDSGPGPLTFSWSKVSGPTVTINNAGQAVANVTPASAGTYAFRLTVSDGAASTSDDMTLTVTSGSALTATFDTALQAPKCATVGSSCDSGTLLNGRDGRGPEPNQPNTVNDACADGTSGTYHSDESNDRIRVSIPDGTLFAAGKTVRVEATVWAWTTPSSDKLDLYYAANASSPSWTFIATLTPAAAGAQTLSATYTLPAGALQAVRARFRYQGSAAACATGSYIDHDDLVFAVGGGAGDTTPPMTSITAPASGGTVSGTVNVTASASDNVGVTRVEFYLDGALASTDTASPYSWSWNTAAGSNGSHSLQSKAYDAAGNLGSSSVVNVTVSNGLQTVTATYDSVLKAPRCSAVGKGCDSGPTLLNGRDGRGPEPNQPNTINGSCADGTSGTYHSDESNDALRIETVDGTALAAGKQVTISATVWVWSGGPTSDHLDLFHAPNANSPSWTLLATITPTASQTGQRTFMYNTFTLPAGSLQAIRAQYRYNGTSASCSAGGYNDRDDLIFAVQ